MENSTTATEVKKFNWFREYTLQIADIDEETKEEFNVFGFCLKIMLSLKNKEITSEQYEDLGLQLERTCKEYNISTECKELKLSLF